MESRMLFDKYASNYEMYRPVYVKELFGVQGFKDCVSKNYSAYRTLSADDYIGFLLSVSPYYEPGDRIRDSLPGKIHLKICEHGTIEVHDHMALHMCRK